MEKIVGAISIVFIILPAILGGLAIFVVFIGNGLIGAEKYIREFADEHSGTNIAGRIINFLIRLFLWLSFLFVVYELLIRQSWFL